MVRVEIGARRGDGIIFSAITPEIQKRMKTALKYAMQKSKADAAKSVHEKYTIKSKDVYSRLRTTISGTVGELKSVSYRTPLEKFRTTPKGRLKRGRYIKVEVERGRSYVNPLIWRKKTGEKIFDRVGRKRFPIRRRYDVSVSKMLADYSVSEKIVRQMEQRFKEKFV